MPIYEYECKKCARRFEHLSKGSKDLPSACPHCGGKRIEKAFSSFSVATARGKDAFHSEASERAMPPACASCPSAGCPHRGH
ncbi:MAG: zinc ribbon domain-containing protein [Kiritimatiellia bacterium]|nr:zinc ribbon domain-containing protein [Kiritimatiellia bacterium]